MQISLLSYNRKEHRTPDFVLFPIFLYRFSTISKNMKTFAASSYANSSRKRTTSRIDTLNICADEQHSFSYVTKYVSSTTYILTECTISIVTERFIPAFLSHTTCMKLQLLYVVLCEVLQLASIDFDHLNKCTSSVQPSMPCSNLIPQ